ncbi:hypothetical protein DFH09DRAFT_1152694 [Mycena vulgaris]|nr:hypothetical protein DFH09DRAFT_1152694 [Mycena vulgaris]
MQEEFWEDNNVAIKYSGQWGRNYHSMYHGSAVMRTRQLGDSMSVKFQGSAIKFMGAQGFDHGTFIVNLDGVETIVDGECCAPNGGVPQVIQFEATGLSSAVHVLNITNLAAGPRGTALEVDALIITPLSRSQSTSHFTLVMVVLIVALVLAAIRRRLIWAANKTSQQMLPLSSPGPSNFERIPSAPIAPPRRNHVRPDKQPYADEVRSTAGGSEASGSGSGRGQQVPPQYSSAAAAGPEVDDALVERIAQRLARIVHDDAPPTYEHTARE